MIQTLGDFIELDTCDVQDSKDFLTINFSATSVPLQQRWRNNGLSADFLAGYLCTFFPGEDDETHNRRVVIKDGVNFVANELLENAMKFNYPPAKCSVHLYMGLKQDKVLLYVTNCIDPTVVAAWQHELKRVLTEDTHALFLEQLIKNEQEDNSDSGLGYLSMINDWNAKLAWKFESAAEDESVQKVTVMVQLPI